MQPEIKQRWLDALRSGEYLQGAEYLKRNNKYCCLGVLADVLQLECFNNSEIDYDNEIFLGLNDLQPTFMHMNDSKGLSFQEIADWIEYTL